jgi:hypothetical protein
MHRLKINPAWVYYINKSNELTDNAWVVTKEYSNTIFLACDNMQTEYPEDGDSIYLRNTGIYI